MYEKVYILKTKNIKQIIKVNDALIYFNNDEEINKDSMALKIQDRLDIPIKRQKLSKISNDCYKVEKLNHIIVHQVSGHLLNLYFVED